MISRIISTAIAIAVILSIIPPSQSTLLAQGQSQGTLTFETSDPVALQGEIAYVLDGDIWLHDLVTNQARRLTSDGNNMLPAWSPDGSMLLYSHGPILEESSLYMLDLKNDDTPNLIVENACCGNWFTEEQAIAYIDLSGTNLAIHKAAIDGSNHETILDPLIYGRASYPLANLKEFPGEDGIFWMIPLEFIAEDNSLLIRRNVFPLIDGAIALPDQLSRTDLDCDLLVVESTVKGVYKGATAYEGGIGQCSELLGIDLPPKGVIVQFNDETVGYTNHFIDWLSYPTISPSSRQLAAELYLEADDPRHALLWGVTVFDADTNSLFEIAEGASQPAWRPQPAVDQEAAQLAQAGEQVVTLTPAMKYQGDTYQVSYSTSGDTTRTDVRWSPLSRQKSDEK